jgi:hypothetical protein
MQENWTPDELANIRERADAGDRDAQCLLGALLASDALGAPNQNEAFGWYRKAAIAGDTDAQYNLGLMHVLGEGTERNPDEGLRWLVQAAELGHDVAAEALAEMYETGTAGLTRSEDRAMKWYERAVERGNARAKYALGLLLLARDSASERARALSLIREAASAGVQQALEFLKRSTPE